MKPNISNFFQNNKKIVHISLIIVAFSFIILGLYVSFLLGLKHKESSLGSQNDNNSFDKPATSIEESLPTEFNFENGPNGKRIKLYEVESPFVADNRAIKYMQNDGTCSFRIALHNNGWPSTQELSNIGNHCDINFHSFYGVDKFIFTNNNTLYLLEKDANGELFMKEIIIGDEEKLQYVNRNVNRLVSAHSNRLKSIYDIEGNILLDMSNYFTTDSTTQLLLDPINEGVVKIVGDMGDEVTSVDISYMDLETLSFKNLGELKYDKNLEAGRGCSGSSIESNTGTVRISLGTCFTHSATEMLEFNLE